MSSSASRMPTFAPLRLPRLGDDRLAALAAAGDERAFEAIYDRHHRALLGFCRHMLGTLEEAEDALQQTFLRAHRALAARGAPTELRPWLFTIARNCCLTMLSARRPVADGESSSRAPTGLGEQVQVRADLRAVVADVERLPDDQRAALVLAELADLSHDQIAEVIGVRTGKVKALIHQARSDADRRARGARHAVRDDPRAARHRRAAARCVAGRCAAISASASGCRAYREAVGEQRRALALVLPVTPSLGLKAGILGAASATGASGRGRRGRRRVAGRRPRRQGRRRGASSSAAPPRAASRSSTTPRPAPVRAPAAAARAERRSASCRAVAVAAPVAARGQRRRPSRRLGRRSRAGGEARLGPAPTPSRRARAGPRLQPSRRRTAGRSRKPVKGQRPRQRRRAAGQAVKPAVAPPPPSRCKVQARSPSKVRSSPQPARAAPGRRRAAAKPRRRPRRGSRKTGRAADATGQPGAPAPVVPQRARGMRGKGHEPGPGMDAWPSLVRQA